MTAGQARLRFRHGFTEIQTSTPDQAPLFGVLDRIDAFGLELLEVLRAE
jgi:hypothetical protein